MLRNKTATQKNFAISPRGDIQRSILPMRQTRKQAFNASELVPIMCEEVLPGDTWQHTESIAARLATPIAPVVDDLYLETFYFFQANRVSWPDWEDFITGTDTGLVIPTIGPERPAQDLTLLPNSVFDHFGLLPQSYTGVGPTSTAQFNVLPIWAYFNIYNEWFRDQNLQQPWIWSDTWTVGSNANITQGGSPWLQQCIRANKPHDYFTSSLPFAQKGAPVTIPIGGTAPVLPDTSGVGTNIPAMWDGVSALTERQIHATNGSANMVWDTAAGSTADMAWYYTGMVTDLTSATGATINALRLAITTQQLLEKDARGGSRYVEQLLVHFGARSPDYRLQRPEYLGGSKIPVTVNPIAQTAAYDAQPDDDPSAVGNLGAEMHLSSSRRTFTYAATEHGYIIGLAVVRATPTYQQGTRKHWLRRTRLDYPFPVFANLGEQAVGTREIYQSANNAYSNVTWGYQERYAEMRYTPNEITGVLRSTNAQPMDWWHYSEEYGSEPALNAAFITDKTQETLARSLATAPTAQWSAQIIMDINHSGKVARMLPAYGVPGLTRL